MGKSKKQGEMAELDRIVEEITTDAYGDDECFVAFLTMFEDMAAVPCTGEVMGEDVNIVSWKYDGNERRGITAKVRKQGGKLFEVAAWEVVQPEGVAGSIYLAAYRRWLGMGPAPGLRQESKKVSGPKAVGKTKSKTKATAKVEMKAEGKRDGKEVELAVLAVGAREMNCRVLEDRLEVGVRTEGMKGIVPGEIVKVVPEKRWVYGGQENLAGKVTVSRIDARALGLEPLKLRSEGKWDPREMDWGEEGLSVEEWTKMLPVNARGKRARYEMEQVVPGADFAEEVDPIMEANELKDAGEVKAARKVLMELCRQDLRCLDAHAHLGNLVFEREPRVAVKHYEVGVRIGELSLGEGFDGVLPWILIDNRPFLRCMHGYGIALWKLKRFKEAEEVFRRMLLLNPLDNQGVRFLIDDVMKKRPWREDMY